MMRIFWTVLIFALSGFILGRTCEFEITDSQGTITSPLYPSPYAPNMNCTWSFTAPAGQVIELTFDVVDLQDKDEDSGDCLDSITVEDGTSGIQPFCGDAAVWPRFPHRYLSLSNTMTVRMRSDGSISGTGFRARYAHVPPRAEYVVGVGIDPPTIIRYDRFRLQGVPEIDLTSESQRPSAVGFDPIQGYFYYTDIGPQPFIGRIRSDGSRHEVIVTDGIASPNGIVVGFLSNLLYWTDDRRDEVSVSRLDGKFRKVLISASPGCASPRGIELSSDQQYLFWTCSNQIERAKADGTERVTLVREIFDVVSIAIDHENELLYWTNINTGTVYGINYHGTGRQTVFSHVVFTTARGFVVENGTFFWSDPVEKRLLIAKVGGDLIAFISQRLPRAVEGLYYYKSDRVTPEQHVCSEGLCSELCFPDGSGFSCEEVTPIINGCPEDILVTSYTGVSTVNWVEPTAESRSSGTTTPRLPYDSRTNAPGSRFFWGNTTVRYRFQDDVGNKAECSFNVVLTQPTTKRPRTKSSTTAPPIKTEKPLDLFGDYLLYTIIGVLVIVLVIAVPLVICITCICGCWQCSCRPNGRDSAPVVKNYSDQHQMREMPASAYTTAVSGTYSGQQNYDTNYPGYVEPNPPYQYGP